MIWSTRRASAIAAAIATIACCALLAPAAGAAPIANGDFEAGSLSGWTQVDSSAEGSWVAYSATTPPAAEGLLPAPPSGSFAAATVERGPSTSILYQDITLSPTVGQTLSMTLFYDSQSPIEAPDTLDVKPTNPAAATDPSDSTDPVPLPNLMEPANQQFRVDVIKPTAPLDSVAPGDILATVFANQTGDLQTMLPTEFGVDLSAFKGQTVRLRLINTAEGKPFNAGVDDVSLTTPPPAPVTTGHLKLNPHRGTGFLEVIVPGAGLLAGVDARDAPAAASARAKKKPLKAPKLLVKPAKLTITAAGIALLPVHPTAAGRALLRTKHSLPIKLNLTYTPAEGAPTTLPVTGTLRLKPKPKRHPYP